MNKADIGLIGLAVMGENLILNVESKGFTVTCYNRTVSKVDRFLEGRARGKRIIGCRSLEELVEQLERPRKIMMMIKAGQPVDSMIDELLPLLDDGDILIDGGNSFFGDTIRRTQYVEEQGKLFVGTGVSGGEEGALHGPSIMPGGSPAAWPHIRPVFQAIAAKVADGTPCCDWVGRDGAGHYVKMVHNGIEYGDMQLIAESYFLMKHRLGMSPAGRASAAQSEAPAPRQVPFGEEGTGAKGMAEVYRTWNQGELNSYLIEITGEIMATQDEETGLPLVELILDTAGQKGTGKWTSQSALDMGTPAPTVAEAVFARFLSAVKEERVAASGILAGPPPGAAPLDREAFIEEIRQALYASKICSYAQGFQLLQSAAAEYGWDLDYGGIALLWREGCIIRAQFLERIKEAYDEDPGLANLLLAPYFRGAIDRSQAAWRRVVAEAAIRGIPVPAFGSALAYYDGYRTDRLPANLLQAQRDYFGAHTYERIDRPRGEIFHTDWTGHGGDTSATTYTA